MLIGERLRWIREARGLTQGDIERRTGLFRCYVSSVENCHRVPALETLEKFARALDVKLYQLFLEPEPPRGARAAARPGAGVWGARGRDARLLEQFCAALARMPAKRRKLLLALAQRMARRKSRR
jgi:transcriptional regulator with XRE-family HTH domain